MTPMNAYITITKYRIFIANVKHFCSSDKSNHSSISVNLTIR